MKTPTPERLIAEHADFLKGLDCAIQEANESEACLEIDELLAEPPACGDPSDVVTLATEVNMRLMAGYLMGADGYIDEIGPTSLIHDSAEAAAKLAVDLTISATAKVLGVDSYLLWSTLMSGKKIHAPTIHLFHGCRGEWLDGRTQEKVRPPE